MNGTSGLAPHQPQERGAPLRRLAHAALPAVLAASLLAASGASGHDGAGPATPPYLTPIQHVVVLYLENQSFDSMLGYWCDQANRCPGPPGQPPLGMPSSVTLEDGATVTPAVNPDIVPNVLHTVAAQQAAMDNGKMDGWNLVPGCTATANYACVSGYEPDQIPNLAALADHFAISDMTFSMADSPSWGGHLYAVMSSLDHFTGDLPVPAAGVTPGPGWGCDSDKVAPWISPTTGKRRWIPSCVPDRKLGLANGGAFEPTPATYAPTIMDRLASSGMSWKIYGALDKQLGYIWATCPSIAECLYTNQHNNVVATSQFTADAMAGDLPNFSLVLPGGSTYDTSEHNGTSMTAGDDWLGQIASAVMNGPEWNSTALFITWDDCGCFYDQVPPGVNPDGTPQGPRVPLVIVSPFARTGHTDSTPTTFNGILAYTEHVFGLKPLGVNDASGYDFSGSFDYHQVPVRPVRMTRRPVPESARHLPALNPDDPT